MNAKLTPPERAESKPPIYPVSVIEVACRALEAVDNCESVWGEDYASVALDVLVISLRIVRDGLASHEKAIKGEP